MYRLKLLLKCIFVKNLLFKDSISDHIMKEWQKQNLPTFYLSVQYVCTYALSVYTVTDTLYGVQM